MAFFGNVSSESNSFSLQKQFSLHNTAVECKVMNLNFLNGTLQKPVWYGLISMKTISNSASTVEWIGVCVATLIWSIFYEASVPGRAQN